MCIFMSMLYNNVKLKLTQIMMTYWKPYRNIHEGNKKVGGGGDTK